MHFLFPVGGFEDNSIDQTDGHHYKEVGDRTLSTIFHL